MNIKITKMVLYDMLEIPTTSGLITTSSDNLEKIWWDGTHHILVLKKPLNGLYEAKSFYIFYDTYSNLYEYDHTLLKIDDPSYIEVERIVDGKQSFYYYNKEDLIQVFKTLKNGQLVYSLKTKGPTTTDLLGDALKETVTYMTWRISQSEYEKLDKILNNKQLKQPESKSIQKRKVHSAIMELQT